ncbi:MAG: O-fucosyltransferase family protein [Phycisphaerae bacterium]|nr:O-fucosyltransferase family protein [Phycisphaerae bacterium]
MPPTTLSPAMQAIRALESGVWGLADKLATAAVRVNPADAAAWNVRGRIALAACRPELAARWFRRARAADPRFKPAEKNLRLAETTPPSPPPPSPAYLLILPWGHGFFSDVDMVLGGLLASEITGRTPVVHWGPGSLFRDHDTPDAWTRFFHPVSSATFDDVLTAARGGVYHPRYSAETLPRGPMNRVQGPGSLIAALHHFPRREAVCVHDFHTGVEYLLDWIPESHSLHGASVEGASADLARRYLRPTGGITAAVDDFANTHLGSGGGMVLAVHARGGDKEAEDPAIRTAHAAYLGRIDAFLAQSDRARVFLITDSTRLLAEFAHRYGPRLITTAVSRTDDARGVHLRPAPSREALGRDVLLDALLAARCDAFLGYGMSNVSCAVRALKRWPAGTCTLIGPVMTETRNMDGPIPQYYPS